MLLSREAFKAMMAAEGLEVQTGAPLWSYEEHYKFENSWFMQLRVPDLVEQIRLLGEQGVHCYLSGDRDDDGLVGSWWGVQDHSLAMELWMRWG